MERKQFRVYQTPKKSIYNHFQLQTVLKKNPKTLKNLGCYEISLSDGSINVKATEIPKPSSLVKLLKNNKYLSSFQLQIQESKYHNFQRIFLALKNFQSISNLSLYYSRNSYNMHKIYRSFTLCTKSLKHLTNLENSLYNSVKVTSPRQALHHFIPFRLLSHLTLNLFSANWLTDLTWRSFSFYLPFLTSLTSLDLLLKFSAGFTQKHALYLFSAFSKLPQLTALKLMPFHCESSDFPVLRYLFENLKDLPHFQDLNLCLDACKNLKSGDQELFAIGLALLNPSSLRKLSLDFYSDFSDSDLTGLFTVIPRFSSLTHLSLKFSDRDKVTAKGLSGLPKALSQFPVLKALNLSIGSAIETGFFFEMISSCLENLKELVSFKVYTWHCEKIDNLGVQRLCSQLPHLLKLENLDLDLGSNSRLDEKCIESISQALRNLRGLKSLSLYWKSDEKVTDQTYEGLIESFGHLKHLREISIDAPINVSQEILEAVGTSLKLLESLNNIFLILQVVEDKEKYDDDYGYGYIEKEIPENYCDDFIGVLEGMEALIDILIFFDGFQFSKKSINIVAKSLKNFRVCP